MKKVLRTFLITLILVGYAGIAGIIYLSQQQPERVQQFLGCTSTTQQQLYADLTEKLNDIKKEIEETNRIVEEIASKSGSNDNNDDIIKTEIQPAPNPVPPPPTQDNVLPSNETVSQ